MRVETNVCKECGFTWAGYGNCPKCDSDYSLEPRKPNQTFPPTKKPGFFAKLFGSKKQIRTEPVSKEVNQSEKVLTIIVLAEGFSGGWPKELSRGKFKKIDLEKLTARLLNYIGRSYRGFPADITQFSSKPEYGVVGGKVGRVANPVQDIKLVQTATLLREINVNTLDPDHMVEQLGKLAFKVIEHYAQTTLAKFCSFCQLLPN